MTTSEAATPESPPPMQPLENIVPQSPRPDHFLVRRRNVLIVWISFVGFLSFTSISRSISDSFIFAPSAALMEAAVPLETEINNGMENSGSDSNGILSDNLTRTFLVDDAQSRKLLSSSSEEEETSEKSETSDLVNVTEAFEPESLKEEMEIEEVSTTKRKKKPKRQPNTSNPLIVFYNLFVPESSPGRARSIVRDQLNQIGKSSSARATRSQGEMPMVYFNLLGVNSMNQSVMNEECDKFNISCVQLGEYKEGFEDHTLTDLYEYCGTHPDARVVYLHNKGSFHYRKENTLWRRSMTVSVVNNYCMNPPDETCNVCGLTFQPVWVQFFAGNFWNADCKYINKLLHPLEYQRRMEELAVVAREKYNFSSGIFRAHKAEDDDFWGTGRFAFEHWIGSHPSLIPCDMSASPRFGDWLSKSHREATFRWEMAPRHKLEGTSWAGVSNLDKVQAVLTQVRRRRREYSFLPGSLHRWIGIYNETPPASSWVWSFYPDSEYWQEGLKKYGHEVLDVLIPKNQPRPSKTKKHKSMMKSSSTKQMNRKKSDKAASKK